MTHRLVKDRIPLDPELEKLIEASKKKNERHAEEKSDKSEAEAKVDAHSDEMTSDVLEKINLIENLFLKKTAEYGRSEHHHGDILSVLFPEGVKIDPEDFTRWNLYNFLLTKIIRYGLNFEVGHPDSILDLIVYALMLMCEDERRRKC
jgi:hypothetical protein